MRETNYGLRNVFIYLWAGINTLRLENSKLKIDGRTLSGRVAELGVLSSHYESESVRQQHRGDAYAREVAELKQREARRTIWEQIREGLGFASAQK